MNAQTLPTSEPLAAPRSPSTGTPFEERPPASSPPPSSRPDAAAFHTGPAGQSAVSSWLEAEAGSTWLDDARRLLIGASLAAAFGVALGLREGGSSFLWGAIGAPLGIVAVGALAAPALGILLALANAPIDHADLGRATSRGAAKAGILLAGLAPSVAVFVVTVEDAITVTLVGFGALILAGTVAARSVQHDLEPMIARAAPGPRAVIRLAVWTFLAFSAVLALRTWFLALPMLTRAS